MVPPPRGQFEDAELRLLLRCVDSTSQAEIPEPLKEWEIETQSEIINVNLETLESELRTFREGTGRSSLLDEGLQPAGCRILESLEMVEWPVKVTVGSSKTHQKVERLVAMLQDADPESESFAGAMALMMELKSEIPSLPDEERHRYAAEVALAFEAILMNGEEDGEEDEEEKKEEPFQKMASDDEA
jgi:hypothetical protein